MKYLFLMLVNYKSILLIVVLCVGSVLSVKLQKGNIVLVISEEHHEHIEHRVNIDQKIKTELQLTQSSRVKIEANVMIYVIQFQFSTSDFRP